MPQVRRHAVPVQLRLKRPVGKVATRLVGWCWLIVRRREAELVVESREVIICGVSIHAGLRNFDTLGRLFCLGFQRSVEQLLRYTLCFFYGFYGSFDPIQIG